MELFLPVFCSLHNAAGTESWGLQNTPSLATPLEIYSAAIPRAGLRVRVKVRVKLRTKPRWDTGLQLWENRRSCNSGEYLETAFFVLV